MLRAGTSINRTHLRWAPDIGPSNGYVNASFDRYATVSTYLTCGTYSDSLAGGPLPPVLTGNMSGVLSPLIAVFDGLVIGLKCVSGEQSQVYSTYRGTGKL